MYAVVMTGIGEPEVLQYQSVPDPIIKSPTEMLVKLKAASVNPIDTKLRQRGNFYKQIPAILGCDGAGIVEAVGSAVTKFKVGDAVYFCHGGLGKHQGNYAEYTTIEEDLAALKPTSLSFVEAAAAPLVLITAWEALYDRARLADNKKVLIHGGAGGVGHMAIQLAKHKDAMVATTVSSQEKAEFCLSLCPDVYPIFYKQRDFVAATMQWTNGEGVAVAFDTVGGKVLEQTFAAVEIYGDVVTILAPDADTNWKVARDRNLRISLELMLTPMLQERRDLQKRQVQILEQARSLFDSGKLTVKVGEQLPLKEAAQAHALLAGGKVKGKVVLIPN
ncbi:MAG: zinc-dependent alcohol dehydrogenase family protein [Pseudanabaenaceae cyanobacterium SKYGB_i_bin29]|nr:zinc-dependent alcohol dehydrogenase family protein [Pseudanabaenaceae cyanobacterium SKYG29]MDW8420823.1 zinc-dependent alcohol dehydrogenase family protein [Pseudanabaenaceae cyanobacterium SKYGB_i_bin29]